MARTVPLNLTSPSSLFARLEDTGAYGLSLFVLIGTVLAIGYFTVQSGLIDREVDEQTAEMLAQREEAQADLVERAQLRTTLDDIRKRGEFNKLIARLIAMILSPLYFLGSFLLIASMLYALVALSGRKPEYHTLMSICVFAGFVELVGYAVRLAMIFYFKTMRVDTSLAGLGGDSGSALLAGVDPFRIWFWILVGLGLMVTRQLGRKAAVASCTLLALGSIGLHSAIAMAAQQT